MLTDVLTADERAAFENFRVLSPLFHLGEEMVAIIDRFTQTPSTASVRDDALEEAIDLTTKGPWRLEDFRSTKGGYISIRGPNGEAICDIFPLAGKGPVGADAAMANAEFIIQASIRSLKSPSPPVSGKEGS